MFWLRSTLKAIVQEYYDNKLRILQSLLAEFVYIAHRKKWTEHYVRYYFPKNFGLYEDFDLVKMGMQSGKPLF